MTTPSAAERRVLVAVDGSPASLEALRVGARMAATLGDRLVGVSLWQPFRHGILPPDSRHPEEAAEQLVVTSAIEAFRGGVAPKIEVIAFQADPADGLVALSHDATMIVVGNRGHSGLSGLLLGSVSNAVAARAACPVLVVHAPAVAAGPRMSELTTDQRIVVTL